MRNCMRIRQLLAALSACALLLSGCSDPAARKQAHFARGMEYKASGQGKEAIIEFRNAVQIDAGFVAAHYQLGLVYLAENDILEAFREFEKVVSLEPGNSEALVRTGEIYLVGGKLEESRKRAERVLALDPGSAAGFALLAGIELVERRHDNAAVAIDKALAVSPDNINYHLMKAQILAANEKPRAAEEAIRKAMQIEPANQNPYRALANLYIAEGRAAAAEKTLQDLVATFGDSTDSHLELVRFYEKQQRFEAAEQALAVAIAKNAGNNDLLVAQGDLYRRQRKLAAAEKSYLAALPGTERKNELRALLAGLYFEMQRFQDMGKQVETILDDEPKDRNGLLLKAKLLNVEGKSAEALAILDPLVGQYPHWGEVHYQKALAHFEKRENELSYSAAELAAKYSPQDPAAHAMLARLHLMKGDSGAALRQATLAMRTKPYNRNAAIIYGKALLHLGETAKAVQHFRGMATAQPGDVEILYNRAMAHLAARNQDQAVADFERILVLKPDYSPALVNIALLYAGQDRLDQAIERVRRQRDKVGEQADILFLLGRLLSDRNEDVDALALLRKAQELAPDNPKAYLAIAQTLVKLNKVPEAMDEYQKLLAKDPSVVGARMGIATLHELRGESGAAKEAYTLILKQAPGFVPAANNLAWLLANEEQPDLGEALRVALLAKEKAPEDPYVADTLGWVHYKRQSYGLAINQFAAAVESLPHQPRLRYHLALALLGQGNKSQAREELVRCMESGGLSGLEQQEAKKLLDQLG